MMVEAATLMESITMSLFTTQSERLDRRITAICKMQAEVTQKPCPAFLWNGIPYIDKESPVITVRGERPALHISLANEMLHFLQDKATVESDKKQISQLLFKLLYQCNDQQEMHDALPDCLHHLTGWNLERKFHQESLIFEERTKKDMEKLMPKIHFYLASRLMNS